MSDEGQLTPDEKEVETVLRSLRPAPARLNFAVAPVTGGAPRKTAAPRLRWWPIAAAAAIACVLAALLVAHRHGEMAHQFKRHWAVIKRTFHEAPTPPPVQPPTLLAYRMALAQSPDQFDALLARQASTASASRNPSPPPTVFTLSKAELYPSRGEL